MKNYPHRSKKFLTRAEYAGYLEAMRQHALATGAAEDEHPSGTIKP